MLDPNPRSPRFSRMLSSRSFVVFHFTFRSVVHFELIFVKRPCLDFFFFLACGYPVVLAPFVEMIALFSLDCFCFLEKDQLTIFVWVYF